MIQNRLKSPWLTVIKLAEAAVMLHKNKKITILALTSILNQSQTLTLLLIITQTQNLTKALTII